MTQALQVSAFAAAKARQRQQRCSSQNALAAGEPAEGESQSKPVIGPLIEMSYGDEEEIEAVENLPNPVKETVLSTWQPSESNVVESTRMSVVILLDPDMRIALIGQYDVQVIAGRVILYGATLHASSTFHTVYAPSTHALPVIANLSDLPAKLELRESRRTMFGLGSLSPLFSNIWHSRPEGEETATKNFGRATFSYMRLSSDDPLKRPLYPLETPPSWQRALESLSIPDGAVQGSIYLVCGPKSSGKSTFARMLANRLQTSSPAAEPRMGPLSAQQVYWLDLDPGQPEFSPSGHLSLVYVKRPVFGPPFTHCSMYDGVAYQVIRSHFLGAISPYEDASWFDACLSDLTARFAEIHALSPESVLIINSPGCRAGQGSQFMSTLLNELVPSCVVHMGEAPTELLGLLRTSSGSLETISIVEPSAHPRASMVRTSAELRAMQMLSYFHQEAAEDGSRKWNAFPLTSKQPWVISYRQASSGIIGIMQLGDSHRPQLLHGLLNGAVVSVVVFEAEGLCRGPEAAISDGENVDDIRVDVDKRMSLRSRDGPFRPTQEASPLLMRTQSENLPFLTRHPTESKWPVGPFSCRALGLALVRGIDVEHHSLHLLIPFPEKTTLDIQTRQGSAPSRIVLVHGGLDTPGWAYYEPIYFAATLDKRKRKKAADSSDDVDTSEETLVPWLMKAGVGGARRLSNMKRRMRRF